MQGRPTPATLRESRSPGVRRVGPTTGEDGGDEAIYSVFQELQPWHPSVRTCPQRVAVGRQGIGPGGLQRLDERIHEGCVPAHPVRAVEDNANCRPRRIVPGEQFFARRASGNPGR